MKELAVAPLTFGQLSVWRSIEDRPPLLRAGANLVWTLALPGECAKAALNDALNRLEERHESLRTKYRNSAEIGIEQVVCAARDFVLEEVELDDSAQVDAALKDLAKRMSTEPFDFESGRLWRAAVVIVRGVLEYVVLCVHHMTADGAGLTLIEDELREILAGKRRAWQAPKPSEIALEQASGEWSARRKAAIEYWKRAVETALPAVPGTADPTVIRWGTLRSAPALIAARRLADSLRVSVHSVVLAAYCRTLSERTGRDRFLVGLMAGNRTEPRFSRMVSSLNQLIPVLVRASPGEELPDLAQRLHWASLRAYSHAMYSVDDLREIAREYGFDGTGRGIPYFYNFMSGQADRREPVKDEDKDWSVEVGEAGRYNGDPFYLRVREEDRLICILQEALFSPDEGAERQLTANVRAFLESFHQGLTGCVDGSLTFGQDWNLA